MKPSLIIRCALATFTIGVAGLSSNREAQSRRELVGQFTNNINSIAFSSDSRLLAIARGMIDDNCVDLWNTETGVLLRTISGFDGPVWSVAFSPDGKTLLTTSSGLHQIRIAAK